MEDRHGTGLQQEGKRLTVRKRYTFTGSVQGVGLRWRAKQAAFLYDCTGNTVSGQSKVFSRYKLLFQGTDESPDEVDKNNTLIYKLTKESQTKCNGNTTCISAFSFKFDIEESRIKEKFR